MPFFAVFNGFSKQFYVIFKTSKLRNTFGTVSFLSIVNFSFFLVSHTPDKRLKRQKRNITPKVGPDEFQNLHFPTMPPEQKVLVFRGNLSDV